ncbi:MAG: hypothetical protein CM1200mP39_11430 [Dehalococcoidia bacterium]|nr:MAG: hypothetical protein CM1200mP39_11430 [Dehalococcoidia bacterium]
MARYLAGINNGESAIENFKEIYGSSIYEIENDWRSTFKRLQSPFHPLLQSQAELQSTQCRAPSTIGRLQSETEKTSGATHTLQKLAQRRRLKTAQTIWRQDRAADSWFPL